MELSDREYQAYVKRLAPRSPVLKNTAFAFLIGGGICALGQLITEAALALGAGEQAAGSITTVALIGLSALLTGCNLYSRLARFGGAGTLVPVTGFANAVTAPAMDFKSEGFLTGTAVKMFTVAGPVIVCGVGAGVLYGAVLMLLRQG